jgi:hypothetical protein
VRRRHAEDGEEEGERTLASPRQHDPGDDGEHCHQQAPYKVHRVRVERPDRRAQERLPDLVRHQAERGDRQDEGDQQEAEQLRPDKGEDDPERVAVGGLRDVVLI